jgi:hypothetical protein
MGFAKNKNNLKNSREPAMIRSRDKQSKSSAETNQRECMKNGCPSHCEQMCEIIARCQPPVALLLSEGTKG